MLVWCSRFFICLTLHRHSVASVSVVISFPLIRGVPSRQCPMRRSSYFEVRIHWREEDLQRWAVVSLVWSFFFTNISTLHNMLCYPAMVAEWSKTPALQIQVASGCYSLDDRKILLCLVNNRIFEMKKKTCKP